MQVPFDIVNDHVPANPKQDFQLFAARVQLSNGKVVLNAVMTSRADVLNFLRFDAMGDNRMKDWRRYAIQDGVARPGDRITKVTFKHMANCGQVMNFAKNAKRDLLIEAARRGYHVLHRSSGRLY